MYVLKKIEVLRDELVDLKREICGAEWELGRLLKQVRDDKLWRDFGCENWVDFIENEVGLSIRTTESRLRVVGFFDRFSEEISYWASTIGISKAQLLVDVFDSQRFDFWKKYIDGITVRELREFVGELKKERGDCDAK